MFRRQTDASQPVGWWLPATWRSLSVDKTSKGDGPAQERLLSVLYASLSRHSWIETQISVLESDIQVLLAALLQKKIHFNYPCQIKATTNSKLTDNNPHHLAQSLMQLFFPLQNGNSSVTNQCLGGLGSTCTWWSVMACKRPARALLQSWAIQTSSRWLVISGLRFLRGACYYCNRALAIISVSVSNLQVQWSRQAHVTLVARWLLLCNMIRLAT